MQYLRSPLGLHEFDCKSGGIIESMRSHERSRRLPRCEPSTSCGERESGSVPQRAVGRGHFPQVGCLRGVIKKGMECEFLGLGKKFKSTVTGIEMFHQTLSEAHAGDQMAALVRGLKRDDVSKGMVMCKPGTLKAYDHVEAQVYVLTKEEGGRMKPFTSYLNMLVYSRTWRCTVQIVIPDKEMVMPGEDAKLIIRMHKAMVLEKGQRFTLREGSVTIGTGVFTNTLKDLNEEEKLIVHEGKKYMEKKRKAQGN